MKPYVGLHYYCRFFGSYAVYKYDMVSADGKNSSAAFVSEWKTQEEARKETYRLNGWGKPKSTLSAKSYHRAIANAKII